MIGDHEVLRSIFDLRESLTVVHHVHIDEFPSAELGIVPAELVSGKPVDITSPGLTRELKGSIQGANLDTVTLRYALAMVTRSMR